MSTLYAGLVYETGLYYMLRVSDINRFVVAPLCHSDFRESSDGLVCDTGRNFVVTSVTVAVQRLLSSGPSTWCVW